MGTARTSLASWGRRGRGGGTLSLEAGGRWRDERLLSVFGLASCDGAGGLLGREESGL